MHLNQKALIQGILNLVNINNIGDTRIYNFLMNKMNDHNQVCDFMTKSLGYEKWYVNKIAYNQKYSKEKYKKLNSANNI